MRRIDIEHEDVGQHAANRDKIDVRSFRCGPIAAQSVPIIKEFARCCLSHFDPCQFIPGSVEAPLARNGTDLWECPRSGEIEQRPCQGETLTKLRGRNKAVTQTKSFGGLR